MKRKLLIGLLILLIVAQAIRPAENKGSAAGPRDVTQVVAVPADVQAILKTSCYDCHSNYTSYPWYDRITPVNWWVAHHINEGKRELNFTEFGTYPAKKQRHKLKEIGETVTEGEMPLSSYLLIHRDARLTDGQKKTLIAWAQNATAALPQQPDTLSH